MSTDPSLELDELRARIEELEAMPNSPEEERSREAWRNIACEMTRKLEQANARIAQLEDAAQQVTPIAPESLIVQSQLRARIAELEGANTRMWDDYVKKRDRIAALEAAADDLCARHCLDLDAATARIAELENPQPLSMVSSPAELWEQIYRERIQSRQRVAELEAERDEQRDNFHAAATYVQDLESALAELRVREKKLVHELKCPPYKPMSPNDALDVLQNAELEAERDALLDIQDIRYDRRIP